MGLGIPDAWFDHEERASRDRIIVLKWFYENNKEALRSFGALEVINTIYILSQSDLTKHAEPQEPNRLVESFQACITGMHQHPVRPNIWQEHLLTLLKEIGFSQQAVKKAIEEAFAANHESIKDSFDVHARSLWGEPIFKTDKTTGE